MTTHRHSTLARLATASAAAGLLVAATATGAQAATTFPHISTTAALASLPGTADLPSNVKLLGKIEVSKAATDEPCLSKLDAVPLTGSANVLAIYSTAKTSKASATDSVWTVSEAVFATPAAAKASTLKLVAAQAKCPKVQTQTVDGIKATLTRTVASPDASEGGLWQGVRTVSHLTSSAAPTKGARIFDTYFLRGNVIVKVTEVAPLAANGVTQDKLRAAVTVATLKKLDAVK